MVDHEIHGADGQRASHKQYRGKYRELAFAEAIEHSVGSRPVAENAEPAGWFHGGNGDGACQSVPSANQRQDE